MMEINDHLRGGGQNSDHTRVHTLPLEILFGLIHLAKDGSNKKCQEIDRQIGIFPLKRLTTNDVPGRHSQFPGFGEEIIFP